MVNSEEHPRRSWHESKPSDASRVGRKHFRGRPGGETPSSAVLDSAELEAGLEFARADDDPAAQARFLTLLGSNHLRSGRFDWAIEAFSEACEACQRIGDFNRNAAALNNLAVAHARIGDWDTAEARLRDITGQRPGDPLPYAAIARDINVGALRAHSRDLATALDHFDRAFARARAADFDSLKAVALNDAGVVHVLQGEHREALGLLERAALLAQRVSATPGLARAYNNIGVVHFDAGRLFEAIPFFEMALSLIEESEDRPAVVELLNNNVLAYEHEYLEPAASFREAFRNVAPGPPHARMRDVAAIGVAAGHQPWTLDGDATGPVLPIPRALFWLALALD